MSYNPEVFRNATPEQKERHREQCRVATQKWRDKNPEKNRKTVRDWKKRNPEKHQASKRRVALKRYYGLTQEQYSALSTSQQGLCAICGRPETRTRHGKPKCLSVDHNHQTGAIRALLCGSCNSALGLFEEDVERIRLSATYLEKWNHALTHTNGV